MDTLENFGSALTLKDRVYQTIKYEIILGRLKAGQRLNILDLANQMNISCAPVREALNMLNRDGLVDLTPYKQPTVAVGDLTDYRISIDLRMMLEPYAARLSVKNIPQERIDLIRAQLEAVLAGPNDMGAYVESDIAVHELLHNYAGSKVLSDTINNLKVYTMRFRYLGEQNVDEQDPRALSAWITTSTREHLMMIDALDSHDPDRAYQAVMDHLRSYAARNNLDPESAQRRNHT